MSVMPYGLPSTAESISTGDERVARSLPLIQRVGAHQSLASFTPKPRLSLANPWRLKGQVAECRCTVHAVINPSSPSWSVCFSPVVFDRGMGRLVRNATIC